MKAEEFARKAHEGQKRKYNGRDYVTHPISVHNRLKQAGIVDETVLTAAFLHDTIEDCDVTHGQLAEEFGIGVADITSILRFPLYDIFAL